MKVMHVDASPKRTHSSSKMLSAHFIQQLSQGLAEIEVDYMDTSLNPPPHIDHAFIEAMYTPASARSNEMQQTLAYSDQLCARVLMSDMLVFAMPMYNFCMPSGFKALIDNLVRPGLTFTVNNDDITGNLSRQKVLFITTRGADLRPGFSPWAHMDALTPALKAAFSFMGVDHPEFLDVQPLENNEAIAKTEILDKAREHLSAVAHIWTHYSV